MGLSLIAGTLMALPPGMPITPNRGMLETKGQCFAVNGGSLMRRRAQAGAWLDVPWDQIGEVEDDGKPVELKVTDDSLVITSAGRDYAFPLGLIKKIHDKA